MRTAPDGVGECAGDPPTVQPEERSTYLAGEARRRDPDRYLCALFAPAARRDAFLGLVLFDRELARIPGAVSQPMAGHIRYQWWREAVDGLAVGEPARRHPVVAELAATLGQGWTEPGRLQALVDAREQALEQVDARDTDALERYAAGTSGALQALLYAVLGGRGAREAAAAASIGTASGLLGIARAVAQEAEGRAEARTSGELTGTTGAMLDRAGSLLRGGREGAGRPPREHMAAFLLASLADHQLQRIRRRGVDAPPPAPELAWPPLAPLRLLARTLARRP